MRSGRQVGKMSLLQSEIAEEPEGDLKAQT